MTAPSEPPLCWATKSFASITDPSAEMGWGFIRTADDSWFLVAGGRTAAALIGTPMTIHVDGRFIHVATPQAISGGLVSFGALTEGSVKAIADGHVLSAASAKARARFPLSGSHDALTATRLCTSMAQGRSGTQPTPARASSAEGPSAGTHSMKRYRIKDESPDAFLNIRAGPSTEFSIRAVIPQGATVEITGSCGAIASRAVWCPVRWGSITGWAHGGGLVEIPPIEAQPHRQASAEPSAPRRPSPKKDDHDSKGSTTVSTGTGFYVSAAGHVLSNAHVVEGCRKPIIAPNATTKTQVGRVIARDASADLALIKLDDDPANEVSPLPWRRDVQQGESVSAFGFPHTGLLASTGTFTKGDVTALAGVRNDFTQFQLSAPLQSGNSGGPIVDAHGNVVGVAVAKLNALVIAKQSGDLPQNVNFAVKASHAASFLDANGITVSPAQANAQLLSGTALAERMRKASVLIVCVSSSSGKQAAR